MEYNQHTLANTQEVFTWTSYVSGTKCLCIGVALEGIVIGVCVVVVHKLAIYMAQEELDYKQIVS